MEQKPEQLHIAPASAGDYKLEDILKEFTPGEAPTPKKAMENTQVFTPITESGPSQEEESHEPVPEETVKIFRSSKDVTVKPMKQPLPPIHILESSAPEDAEEDREDEDEEEEDHPEEEAPVELLRRTHKALGRLLILRVFLAVTALAGMFLLLYNTKGWEYVPFLNEHTPAIVLGLMAVGMVLSLPVLWKGLRDLFRFRVSLHTIGSISAVVCLIYSFSHPDTVYAPLVTTQLFFLLQTMVNEQAAYFFTARTLASFKSPMGVCNAPTLPESAASLRRDPGNVADFMAKLKISSLPQDLLCVYASILLTLLPVLAYFLSRNNSLPYLQVWLLLLLGSMPYAGMLCFFKPFRALARKLGRYGGALCGWHGAQIFGGKHTIILRDGDLFPRKGIISNGMKLFNGHDGAKIISYALAALEQAESPLRFLFETLLQEQYGKHSRVKDHRFYDHGGVGVEIGNDIVLVGNLSFIRSMGVHMPTGTRVRQAVYVSVNGELAGIFALRYKPNNSTRDGLRDVLANRNFSVILATRDFLITPELIAAKYALPTDTMEFPDYTERLRLSATHPEQAMSQGALIAADTFGALAVTVAAGRTLKNTSLVTTSLTLCAGALGLLLTIFLIAWNALAIASPMHIVSFQLLWGMVTA
ncbi:MAG: hypothetical protein IKM59_06035, partial [Oscillospiraceae bacterium]|nr:hypothetical protein [Oscillospiraceae bacterium]